MHFVVEKGKTVCEPVINSLLSERSVINFILINPISYGQIIDGIARDTYVHTSINKNKMENEDYLKKE